MPVLTNRLRWFIPQIPIDIVEHGDLAGNKIWGDGVPVLQQCLERTDAEIDMFQRMRGITMPKEKWVDIPIVKEER